MTDTDGSVSDGSGLGAQARAWFDAQHAKMVADLEEVRSVHDHSTTKGDGTEQNWLKMLQTHLPNRYQAEKAFVIDADGRRSDQLDIVIHDRQYCPCLLDTRGGRSIPAESVYAVIEVKQAISKGQIEYAGQKVASVRSLRRTSALFGHTGGQARKELHHILGGVVAYKSDWRPPLGDAFVEVLRTLPVNQRVDFGCVITGGGFDVEYSDDGAPTVIESAPESSLIFFLFRLLHRLQRVGTVPGIEYDQYSNTLVLGRS